MRAKTDDAALVLLCSAALGGLALLVRSGTTHQADVAATRALQGLASPALDLAVNIHTLVGLAIPTTLLALTLAAGLWRRGHGPASFAPLLIVLTAAIELTLKLTTGHAPPGGEFDRSFIEPFGPRLETPSAFPSGHAARLTFLSLLIALLAGRRVVWTAAAALIAFTLFARVYIGDHWMSDVIGGLALGAGCAIAAVASIRRSAASRSSAAGQRAASKSSLARRK